MLLTECPDGFAIRVVTSRRPSRRSLGSLATLAGATGACGVTNHCTTIRSLGLQRLQAGQQLGR